jgi:hypothetical protein
MTGRLAVLVLLPALALGACAAQTCNPSTAGFFSGIGCEVSGANAQNEQALQRTLGNARQELARQRAAAQAADAQRSVDEATLAAMQARLRDTARQDAQLRRQVEAARARQGADAAAVQRAQTELGGLEAARRAAATAPNPAAMEDVDRRRRAVMDAITAF